MKKYKFKKIRTLNIKNLNFTKLDNKTINVIVYNLKKILKKQIQTKYTKKYIDNSFNLAFQLIKKDTKNL